MSLGDRFHKKMLKLLLWGIIKLDQAEEEALINSLAESAKPRMRGIRAFFSMGFQEFKKSIKMK